LKRRRTAIVGVRTLKKRLDEDRKEKVMELQKKEDLAMDIMGLEGKKTDFSDESGIQHYEGNFLTRSGH
jgi:hypothetical protein